MPKEIPPRRSSQIPENFGMNVNLPKESHLPWNCWWWAASPVAGIKWVRVDRYEDSSDLTGIPVGVTYHLLNKDPFIEDALNSRGYRRVFSKQRMYRYGEQNHLLHNNELYATELGMDHLS